MLPFGHWSLDYFVIMISDRFFWTGVPSLVLLDFCFLGLIFVCPCILSSVSEKRKEKKKKCLDWPNFVLVC